MLWVAMANHFLASRWQISGKLVGLFDIKYVFIVLRVNVAALHSLLGLRKRTIQTGKAEDLLSFRGA